jgi:hypothetical protein
MHPQPGEVWLVDLGLAAKTRPVVIVSRYDPEPPRALVLYVPLTTQNRQSKSLHLFEAKCFVHISAGGREGAFYLDASYGRIKENINPLRSRRLR